MIDLTDVQSLVARPTRNPNIRITYLQCTPDGLRALLGCAVGDGPLAVTSSAAASGCPPTTNLGLTADGLRILGISRRAHDALPAAFTRGMAAAAARLGDPPDGGASWDPPLAPDPAQPGERPDVHAVLIQQANEPFDDRRGEADDLAPLLPDGVAALRPSWTGQHREDGTEPFGFRDDISHPELEGIRPGPARPGNGVWDPATGGWRKVKTGEAILGHVDESGAVAGHPDAAHLERNGSYLVIRRLEQDVAGFEQACSNWAGKLGWRDPNGQPDGRRVAAQLVGRNHDGSVLGRDDVDNDFLYRDHRFGAVDVPPSSHIRRTNPRDDLAFAESIVARHILFRRGYPYDDAGREGLLFLACCADIHRQFEFVQRHWIDDGDRFGLGPERDPLVGNREEADLRADAKKASVDDGGRRCRHALATFVHHRGGTYVLLPALRTLALLAATPPQP